MSVDKFRFVSPGVFVNEIDNSQVPRTPEAIGPVIIGRSARGPMMRPVKVGSFSDFVDIFGNPEAGAGSDDVWRNPGKQSPTYAAYAAQAYLKNSSPITFVRLGGYENGYATATDLSNGGAGWSAQKAYGLFVFPTTGSSNSFTVPNTTGSLAAVFYTTAGATVGLTGLPLSGSTQVTNNAGAILRDDGSGNFSLVIDGVSTTFNLTEGSAKYIRSVFNTNPTLTNTSITDSTSTAYKKYWLGETHKAWLDTVVSSSTIAAVVLQLKTTDANVDASNFIKAAQSSQTGWIFAQHTNANTSSFNTASVQNLFQVVSLTEGEWNQGNLKISIEDIKFPTNEFVKYGTFTLSVRKMDDTDANPVYLERFTGLSLDPVSENYIVKKIGDKFSVWDSSQERFLEYGTYNNQSKFIRVVIDPTVDAGGGAGLLPFGFFGPQTFKPFSVSGSAAATATIATTALASSSLGAVSGNAGFNLSLVFPEPPLLTNTAYSNARSLSTVYWGLKTNIGAGKKFNKDVVDVLRVLPSGVDSLATPATYLTSAFFFSLDDVASNGVTGSWQEGNRVSGASLSALSGAAGTLETFNRFTMPLVSGFDGLNITEKDPFNKRVLTSATETTSYAFNSIKVAINAISDPEVVEMNLATIPGVENSSLTDLLIEKCETRGDSLAVIDLEGDYVPAEANTQTAQQRKPVVATVVTNLSNRSLNSSYGCAFFPWVLIRDTINNNTVWVPSSVAALGTFSNSQRQTELWFAPAGFNRGGLSNGAAGIPVVQTALRLTSKDRDTLYASNINPIATFPAEGIVIFGQKTLQVSPSALDRINVRRLMIYLKKEISRMATTVLFDQNIEVTWKRFTNQAEPLLASVKARFGLTDYRLILDETTTTPELVDRNIVYAKVLLKPARAIEFIALDFVVTNTGASFAD